MASTNAFEDLRKTPAPDGEVIVTVDKGEKVTVLETKLPDWVRVRRAIGSMEGWLPKVVISDVTPPLAQADKGQFMEECAHHEQVFLVIGHYLAAIAQLRSKVMNDVDPTTGEIGLYRLTQTEWATDWKSEEDFGFKFDTDDIDDWRNQCTLFALMARRALDAFATEGMPPPTSVELYLAQLIGIKALKELKKTPSNTIKQILAAVADADLPPGGLPRDDLIKRHRKFLEAGGATATGTQAMSQVEIALAAALITTAAFPGGALVGKLSSPSAVPSPTSVPVAGLKLVPPDVPANRKPVAEKILAAFSTAGFGVVQQATALANAIAESGLNPDAQNVSAIEASFGLFQLNTKGGLGTGHAPADLVKPDFNIAIIVKEAKTVASFGAATSLADAVSVFVTKIERPQDTFGEINKRLAIAKRLVI